jgi:hypothetical protein
MTVDTGQYRMTILNLPVAVGLDGTELVPCVQSGVTVYTTINDILATGSLVTTVAQLPSAVTAGAGARYIVTNADDRDFGFLPSGGGGLTVPVYSDGTVWRMGG